MGYEWRTPKLIRRLIHRVGFRGYILLTAAVLDVVIGWTFVSPGAINTTNIYVTVAIPFPSAQVALWTWAWAWWTVAGFCLVNAFKRKDHWGYGMAIAIKVAYVTAVIYGWQHGMPNGLRTATIWVFITGAVLCCARWAEPSRSIREISREIDETGEIGERDA